MADAQIAVVLGRYCESHAAGFDKVEVFSRVAAQKRGFDQTASGDGISSQRVRLNEAWY
jgi:hypothetical protein